MAEGWSKGEKERLAKLKAEEQVISKSCKASLNSIKWCDQKLASDINMVAKELEEARKHEKNKINKDLGEIYEELEAFQTKIEDDSLLDFDPTKCKEKLLHIQNKIVKSRQYLEKEIFVLKNEEKALFEEVLLAQRRIEEGNKYETSNPQNPSLRFTSSKISKNYNNSHQLKDKDIENFEGFVEKHGHLGGWEEQDHLLFLKLRSKYHKHNTSKIYSMLTSQLPDITETKISEHMKWYEEYEILREKNRLAIQKWRESKMQTKRKEVCDEKLRKNSTSNSTDASDSVDIERRKMEITEWKKQKQLLKEQKERELKSEQEAERARWKQERDKQVKIREEIEKRKQLRDAAERDAKMEQQKMEIEIKKERAEEAKKMIKIYRRLDSLHVERLKLMKIKKQEKKEMPQVPDAIEAERDPDRLLQMTKVWQAKCKVDDEDEKPTFPRPHLHLRNIPHLGIPQWRQGIN